MEGQLCVSEIFNIQQAGEGIQALPSHIPQDFLVILLCQLLLF